MKPPQPKKIPKIHTAHGDERIDDYYWLRDDTRKNPEVISYLEAENKYLESWFESKNDCRKEIYNELVSFIPPHEVSMKVKYGDYYYFSEISSDQQYKTYYREINGNKELVLDVNELAKDLDYFNVASITPSPNNHYIAYAEDLSGRREYNIKIKNLETGQIIDESIQRSSGSVVWNKNNDTIYYALKDPVTLIENKVFKHKVGTDTKEDILIYEEKDTEFHLHIFESRTKKYLNIYSSKTEASETWLLDLDDENSEPFCILERSEKHLYSIEDSPECFYASSNKNDKKNFEILKFNLEQINNFHTLVIHSTDNSFGFGYRKNNKIDSDKLFIKQFDNDLCNNLIVEFNKFISKENLQKVNKISVSIGPANFNSSRLIVVLARTISQQINCPLDSYSSF